MRYVKKPAPPQGNGPQEVWLRRFLEWVSQFECVGVLGGLKKPHPNGGYSIIVSPSSGGGGGEWRWAASKTYDHTLSYAKDEIVVVLPSAAIVTAGVASADDAGAVVTASGGIWIALQAVAPVLHSTGPDVYWYHIPKLPMPNEADMDATANYWLQLKSLC